ncbi:hypothetical protein D3C72_577920 [compost metagenome]
MVHCLINTGDVAQGEVHVFGDVRGQDFGVSRQLFDFFGLLRHLSDRVGEGGDAAGHFFGGGVLRSGTFGHSAGGRAQLIGNLQERRAALTNRAHQRAEALDELVEGTRQFAGFITRTLFEA